MHTGADHADEILSVLGLSDKQSLYSKYHVTSYSPILSDKRMSSLVMNYWVNFARLGELFLFCNMQAMSFKRIVDVWLFVFSKFTDALLMDYLIDLV